MSKIKLFLVDDHKMIRDAMINYLSYDDRFEIVGEANHGEEALQVIPTIDQVDVLVTDIVMPQMDGIELVKQLKAMDLDIRILVLSMLGETQHIKKMLNFGVNGYVLKSADQSEIIEAIIKVNDGETYYSARVMESIMENLRGNKSNYTASVEVPLTKREMEVLHLICKEYSNKEIADKLFISIRTVEAHKRNLLEKSGHKNMAGLALWAAEKMFFEDI